MGLARILFGFDYVDVRFAQIERDLERLRKLVLDLKSTVHRPLTPTSARSAAEEPCSEGVNSKEAAP